MYFIYASINPWKSHYISLMMSHLWSFKAWTMCHDYFTFSRNAVHHLFSILLSFLWQYIVALSLWWLNLSCSCSPESLIVTHGRLRTTPLSIVWDSLPFFFGWQSVWPFITYTLFWNISHFKKKSPGHWKYPRKHYLCLYTALQYNRRLGSLSTVRYPGGMSCCRWPKSEAMRPVT